MKFSLNNGKNKWMHRLTPVQILVICYMAVIITGFILLSLPIATTTPGSLKTIDALFTSTSATCVTGLTVVSTKEDLSLFGQIVVLLQFQLGGLGVMAFSTLFALILGRKISLRGRLLIQEDLNQYNISGLVRLMRYVLSFTLVFQGFGTFLLWLRLRNLYDGWNAFYHSVFHAVSAFNNAGFDLFGNSLENFTGDVLINLVIMSLIVFGGLGFGVIVEIFYRVNGKRFSLTARMVFLMTFILLTVGFLTITALEWNNPETLGELSGIDRLLAGGFLSVTSRTAGFNTVDTSLWRPTTLLFVIVLMFIGASPGSTGGGIKTTTLTILIFSLISFVSGKRDIEVWQWRITSWLAIKAFILTILAFSWVFMITFGLSFFEEEPLLNLLFEATSAFGTVGLSTGITENLETPSKVLLIMSMLIGRVGVMSFAIALSMKRIIPPRRFPEGYVMVG